ncbi:SlyX family protein [Aquisalimonas sp. 2447]|uniref:SlyX family protein n=1 Tax=Aquisalimonas sp. 2447 TaxID=2740807 RepID=UPI0014323A16|nr:SlyX family protein [Aquisalimonas sp. 2447]QIT55397.1 SlyX family protein [Aquisalimonas sp. 2447]
MSNEESDRLADLEIRLMHQEDTIDALTESLVRQQRIMDQLHEHIEQLRRRLQGLEEPNTEGDGGESTDPPPPHY